MAPFYGTTACHQNTLTSLNLNNNTDLAWFSCSQNNLNSLDLRNNLKLSVLNCTYNELSTLDLSKNNELDFLYCENNNITGNYMTAMIHSLPDRTGKTAGQVAVFDETKDDKNRCLVSDVAIAASKNWVALKYYKKDGYYYTYGEYSGW